MRQNVYRIAVAGCFALNHHDCGSTFKVCPFESPYFLFSYSTLSIQRSGRFTARKARLTVKGAEEGRRHQWGIAGLDDTVQRGKEIPPCRVVIHGKRGLDPTKIAG